MSNDDSTDDAADSGPLSNLSRDALADVAVEVGVNPEGKSKAELIDLVRAAEPKPEPEPRDAGGRFPATDDGLAVVLVLFAVGASTGLLYTDGSLPVWLTFVDVVAILTAVVWVFGRGAFKTATSAARTVLDRIAKSN